MKKFTPLNSFKRFFILVAFLISYLGTWGQTQYIVTPSGGTAGNTNGTGADPICRYYNSIRYQVVYTAAELNAAGIFGSSQITRLAWNVTESSASMANYTVKMANTTATNSAAHNATVTTTVKNAFTYGIALGYNDIIFDVPFTWDGVNNLLVEICSGTTNPFASPYGGVQAKTGITSASRHYRVDGTSACGTNTNLTNTTKPYVRLTIASATPCSGTPNPGTAAISSANGCSGASVVLSASGLSTGTGLSFQWQSGPSATGPWTNIPGGTTANFNVSPTVNTYYQLISSCAGSGISSISNVISRTVFTSLCQCTAYCNSNATSSADDEIFNVTLGTLNNTSACGALAPGPGSIVNQYGNFTSSVAAPSLMQGSSYPLSVSVGMCGSFAYSGVVTAYIDYNQNGLFTDLGEQIYVSPYTAFAIGGSTVNTNITIPVGALPGITRMRVVEIESSVGQASCGTFTWGETEDYCVNIIAAPPCTGTPTPGNTNTSAATTTPGGTVNLSLQTNTLGTGVTYQWQSGPSSTGPWTNVGPTTSTYAATVSANTWYQCVVTCTGSGLSAISNPVQITLSWCTPSGSINYYLTNVTTSGGASNFTNPTGASPGGYGNYSSSISCSNIIGTPTNITLSSNFGSDLFFCWIDWNNDLDFLDANEAIFATGTYAANYTGTINIPLLTPNGSYRMRVANSYIGAVTPCGPNTYGEYEDYTFVVLQNCNGVPQAPVASVIGSSTFCYGNTTVLNGNPGVLAGGVNYQWAMGTASGGPYNNITGATSLNYTTSNALAPGTYYMVLNATCSYTSQTSVSNEVNLTINGASSSFTMNPSSFCGAGGSAALSANPAVNGATYSWTNTGGSLSVNSGSSTTATLSQTSEFTLSASINGCTSTTSQSIGVYAFPSITPTAVPSTICGGTSSIMATGLSASNFAAICITPSPLAIPPSAAYLANNGVAAVGLSSGSLDDGGWANIPLGFSFNFFGTNYSTINVGTNGVLQFGTYNATALGDFIIGALPNTVDPLGAIYGCANDLHCGYVGANVRYWTTGSAPNRKFIASYSVFQYGYTTTPVNFQVILYETLGQVDIIATNIMSTNPKSIGVNSPTGTIGAAAPNCAVTPNVPNYWSANTATIPSVSPQAWKFIPPVNYVHNWSVNGTPNPATGQLNGVTVSTSSTTQSPVSTTAYQVYIQDPITGCSQVFQTPVTVLPTPVAPIAVSSTQCGTQVPTAAVSCPTCTGNQTFNWYTAATNGNLYQGVINENFNTSTTGTLFGNAALSGARCVLTDNVASQNGALLLGSTGVNSNAYNITFDFQVGPSDALGFNGADGFSYSFGNDVSASAPIPAAENGSGTKLKLGFVSYTNGGSTAGIYLMYNCNIDEQTPGTAGVIAYSNDMSWKNTSSPVALNMTISATGQVTLTLNGVAIFTNVALPPNYLIENKATWLQLFKARTGSGFSRHAIDNVQVVAQPAQAFTSVQQAVSNSVTYYVQTIDGLCGSTSLTPISITVNQAPAFGITPAFTACQNGSYPLTVVTGGSSYTNFIWTPAALLFNDAALTSPYVAGTNATTVYFSAATVGAQPAITCSATDGGVGSLQCGASASVNLTVQANPIAPIISAGTPAVCTGSSTTLSVQSGAVGGAYCASAANYTYDEEIFNVTIGTLNNTSNCFTPAGGPGSVLEKYSNFTSGPGMPVVPSLTAGGLTAGSVTIGSCGSFNYTSGLAIFVDLNQDGDFLDAGEKVYSNGPNAVLNCVPATAVAVNLNIPSTALNGQTRMRVVNQESYGGDNITPCQIQSWGETEDYMINITGGISYSYTWSPAVAGNATTANVTTLPLSNPTAFSAIVNNGTCSSAPSNVITVGIAATPIVTTAASSPVSGYCNPNYSSGTIFGDNIGGVQLGNINNITGGSPAPYTTLYPAAGSTTTSLAAGSSNTISLSSGTYPFNQNMAVWIDFNQNGLFTDLGEKLGEILNVPGYPASSALTFTIPSTAVNGPTRMRVMDAYYSTNLNACGSYSYGETEDYTVTITGGATNIPCPGSTFNLSSTASNGGAPYTYAWTVVSGSATLSVNNIANPTAVVNTDATLQLTVTDLCGSIMTSTVVANIDENPITITPANSVICINSSTTLTAANGSNYTWSPTNNLSSGNTAVTVANPSATTTYTVTGTYGIGCTGATNTTITVNPLPVVDAGLDQTVCLNTAVVVNGTGATSYTWNNNVTNGVAFTPTTTATYTVTGTNVNGCVNQDQVLVTVNPLPNVNAGLDQTVCLNTAVSVNGSGATTYTWNNSVSNGVAFTPNSTQTYTVTGVDGNGCVNQDQVLVTVNPLPNVNAGLDQTVCLNTAVVVNGSGATSYTWNNNVTNGIAFTPATTATYTVTGTNVNGCVNQDQVLVTVNPLPNVYAGLDQTICINAPVTLSGSGATTYTWDNNGINGVSFNPTTTLVYTVTGVDGNGCVNQDQVLVTVNPLPNVNAGLDQTICINAPVTLSGSGATTYTWDNNGVNGVSFNPTTTLVYTVTGVDGNGCVNQDQVLVTVNPLPNVNAGLDQTLCFNSPVTLSGSGASTYTWNNNVVNAVAFNTTLTTTYTVTGVDVNGCVNQDQVLVNVNALPLVNAGLDTAFCINGTVTLSGSGANSYQWTNNVLNGVSFNPTNTNTYTVTGVDLNGCANQDQVLVTVYALPNVSAGQDYGICLNTQTALNGTGAASYTWNNNVTNGVSFTPTITNTYTVVGIDANGCVNQDQVMVTVYSLPTINAGQDITICSGNSTLLSASGAVTYIWNNGVVNGQAFTPTTSQTYVVTGTNANGCSGQDALNITVNYAPIVSLTTGASVCANGSVALSATSANAASGFWITSNGTGSISPNVSNDLVVYHPSEGDPATVNFNYVAFNQCGTVNSSTTIAVLPLPTVNAGQNISACTNSNVMLTATISLAGSVNGGTVVWNSGLINSVPFPAVQGTTNYIATATATNGCVNSDTVAVTGLTLPSIDAGSDQTVCAGETVTLNGAGGTAYTWNNGAVDGVAFVPISSGMYTVTGTGSNGCTNQDAMNLSVNALPNAGVVASNPITLVATPPGANYQWINCANGQALADQDNDTLVASSNGSYAVVVTNANGCSDTSECMVVNQVGLYFPESAIISLFPNPTNGMVTIELPSQDGAAGQIFDAQGKLVMALPNISNGAQVDLSMFTTGIYTFKIQLNSLTHIEKVVKQ